MNIAIVGCGKMSCNHVEKCLRLTSAQNIGLLDKQLLKARLLGEMYGIDNVYDSFAALVEAMQPGIFHVVTPPAIHKQVAIKCMEAGGHVYIEKPVCLSVRDFDEIDAVAKQTGKLVCVGHQRLFERQYVQIKQKIADSKMGRILHIHGYDSGPYLEMQEQGLARGWWQDLPGGMYVDLLPHILGVFCDLVPDLRFENSLVRRDSRNRPAGLEGWFISESADTTCSFHIAFDTSFFQNYIQIECEKGVLTLNLKNKLWYANGKTFLPELAERLVSNFLLAGKIAWGNTKSIATLFAGRYDPYEGIGCLIREFYDAVANGLPSPTPAQAVRQVARLTEDTINNAFQSAPAKYPISIPNETTVPSHLSADVLVTGGAGFIGTHLVRRLLSQGKGVRVVSRKKIEKSHFGVESGDKVQIVIGDLRDSKFVEYACSGVKTVYHLAAATKGDLFDQVESTCVGTKNLLKGIRDNQVDRLVYVSSVSILDQTSYPKNGIIDESFALEPHPTRRGAYTYAKLQSEKLVQSFANEYKDIKVCVIRPGIVWGPGKRQELLETNFQLGGRLMIVLGQRKKRLPLVYVENLVDALIMAGNGEIETGECFNIVDDVNPTQGDYLKIMRNLTGRHRFTVFVPISLPLPLFWVAQKMLAHILRKPVYLTYQMRSKNNRVEYSVELAKNMLGFRSNVAFKEGLVRYQQWLNQIEE